MGLQKVDITVVERMAPQSGPTSSADYNATNQEMINSFAQIANAWNNSLQPLLDSLPSGNTSIVRDSRVDYPDPFTNGFDGSQVYMDCTSTEIVEDGKYFSTSANRPLTIKESFEKLEGTINENLQKVLVQITKVSQSTGITPRQKQAIGARIFDPEQTSAPSSLDGLMQEMIRNMNQVELDLSGNSLFLTGLGTQTLTHPIIAQLVALQAAHQYDGVFNVASHGNLDIHAHKYHVIPIGDLNGINKTYYLPNSEKFVANTLQVYINGIETEYPRLYAEHPDRRGFTLTSQIPAPLSDDHIWIHYIVG